jgi:oligopeptidase A
MHPFADPAFAIRWSTLVPDAVENDIRHGLDEARAKIDAICALPHDALTYENTFHALGKASETLNRAWGRLTHLDSVADEPAQRAALNKMLPEVSAFYSSIPLRDDLWQVLKLFGHSDAVTALSSIQRRHVEETMLDFEQDGADLPSEQKARIAEIDAGLSALTKQYAEHVLDSTNAWDMVVYDEARLSGLPESAKAAAAANAKAKGLVSEGRSAWRFTLHQPSMFPVMQFAADESLRRELWQASMRVGAEGEFDNSSLVWQILSFRQEKSELLGQKHFADLVLQRRMAKNGDTALSFVEDLHDRIVGAFRQDYRELCAYKAERTNGSCEALEPWEVSYWAEKRRKEFFDLDSEALRPYFPVTQVMEGMFRLASTLFGIEIRKADIVHFEKGQGPESLPAGVVEGWHPEVTFYELRDTGSGEHLGSFYADWHPRESKRGGAWMNQLEAGSPSINGKPRRPHLGLIIGNMTPPVDGEDALLTHEEVETIFHEFGHLLHGLLSDVEVESLSGTNVPWDFVELPSQIMENFCWTRASLDLFARHHQTGEVIPEDLFAKMIAAKNYMSATTFMRQLALGKLDLALHMHPQRYAGRDLDAVEHEILADYRAPLKTEVPGMARRFNHLFSSPTGYAAGYYSYKWAEVLDADAFTRFEDEGILNPGTGHAFRESILSQGNSAPADELYRRFMGRDPHLEPLLQRAGLIDDALLAQA